jgi:hypothetical protein
MRTARQLTRLYDQLTPAERIQLVMRARSRADEEEVGRLLRACPRRSYTAPDHDFLELWEAAPWVAERAWMLWLEYQAQLDDTLRRVESFLDAHHYFLQGYVRGGRAVWEAVRHQGIEPPDGQNELTEAEIEQLSLAQAAQAIPQWLEQEAQAGLARLQAVPLALDRFCDRIGVARTDILTWFPPLQEQLDALQGMLASDVPADEETAADIERLFVENWPGLSGPQPT